MCWVDFKDNLCLPPLSFCRFSYTKRFRALRRCVSEGGHRSELNGAEENFHQVCPRPVKRCACLWSMCITKLIYCLGQTWDHRAVENPSTATTRGGRWDGHSDEDQAPQTHGTGTRARNQSQTNSAGDEKCSHLTHRPCISHRCLPLPKTSTVVGGSSVKLYIQFAR